MVAAMAAASCGMVAAAAYLAHTQYTNLLDWIKTVQRRGITLDNQF